MSSLVDERIVQMGFDNKNFESNVKTSMGTLDKLKSSLNFSGVSDSINKNLRGVDTSVLASGLNTVSNGFSAMEVIAISALANITNRVIDLGLQMISSLSFDNIMSGWDKYAEKTTSVATLIAQGYDMETVNEQLEKLLWYTDETSYSFTDMVSNISKFTATGQTLEDSVQAMMGIANWAALSGQNATTASRAMYQLSQAMGAGVIRLQDWRSIQTANMDTKEFRQMALDAAVAAGTLTQAIDGTYTTMTGKSFTIDQFTTEFDEGWFTSDVLIDTLSKYSGAVDDLYEVVKNNDDISTTSQAIAEYGDNLDEFGLKAFKAAQEAKTFRDAINSVKDAAGSGWMNIFENIFGGYEDSKVIWTDLANELYDIFVEGLNLKNAILKEWSASGGRNDLFANTEEETGAFWNLFYAIVEVKNLIGNAWRSIFGFSDLEDGAERITDISNKLKSFTERLKELSEGLYMSEETAEIFTNILTGMFSILKAFIKALGALWTGIKPVISAIKTLAGQILYLLSLVGKQLTEFVATTEIFNIAGEKLANILSKIIEEIKSFQIIDTIQKIVSKFTSELQKNGGTNENFIKILNGLKAILEIVTRAFLAIYNIVKTYVLPIIQSLLLFTAKLAGIFGGTFIKLLTWVADLIIRFNEFTKTNNTFQNGLQKLVNFIQSIPSRLSFLTPFLNGLKNILIGLWDILLKLPTAVSGFFKSLTGSSIGDVASNIGQGLSNMLSSIRGTFNEFGNVDTSGVDKFNNDVTNKFQPLQTLLEGLGKLFNGLWSVLKAVVPVIGQLLGYIGEALGFLGEKLALVFSGESSLFSIETLLDVAFWTAILVSVYKIVDVFNSIQDAFYGVLQGFSNMVDSAAMMNYAEALKTMSIGILILVAALILLASIDSDKLTSSLASLAVLMGMLVVMMKAMQSMFQYTKLLGVQSLVTAKAMDTAAWAMLAMAGAVLILALAAKMLAKLDQAEMVNGLLGITMIIAVLMGAAAIIGKNSKVFDKGAKGLIKMALAVWLMSVPLKKLGQMDPKQMQQGILGVTALVGLMTLFVKLTGSSKKATKVATGMISFSAALLIATIPLKIIGGMGWDKLAVGMTGLLGLTALMISMALASKYVKKALTTSFGMIMFAEALLIASIPLRIIGGMGWDKLAVGMVGLTGIVALMVTFGTLSKYMKGALTTSIAMIAIGIALTEFAIAVKILGSMKWESLAKAGVALLGLVVIMVAISKLISGSGTLSMIGFALALSILSVALIAFSIAVAALNLNSWTSLAKTLLVIVAAMTVLAIAAKLLSPVIPAMLGLAAAMLLFAAAALVLAVAISLITTTIGIFGGIIGTVLIKVADAIIEAGPKIMQALATIIIALLEGLNEAMGSLFELLGTIVSELLKFLIEQGPAIIETVIMLLDELLASIAKHFPSIVSSLISMVITLLEALKENIGTIIDIVIDIILNLLIAIKNRVPDIIETLVEVVIELVDAIVKAIIELVPRLVTAAFDLVLGIIDGLGQAIEDNAGRIRETMINFCNHLWNAFLNFFGIHSPSTKFMEAAGHLIDGLWQGLVNGIGKIVEVIKQLCTKVIEGIKSFFTKFGQVGSDIINNIGSGLKSAWSSVSSWFSSTANSIGGFFSKQFSSFKQTGSNIINNIGSGLKSAWSSVSSWFSSTANSIGGFFTGAISNMKSVGSNLISGLKSGMESAGSAIKNTVETVANNVTGWFKNIFGIKSPSRVFAEIGMFLDQGLAKGMSDNSDDVYNSAESVGDDLVDGLEHSGISTAVNQLYNSLNNEMGNEFVIRPVMDLTEIQNGKNQIFGMMRNLDGYALNGSTDTAERTLSSTKNNNRNNTDSTRVNTSTSEGNTNTESGAINNVFNISGSNPKEIAKEVAKTLQDQIDRRKAKNGQFNF